MTGVTLDLTPWQVDEVRRYLDGPVVGRASSNLVRRGFLIRVRLGTYALTMLGRAAFEQATDSAGDVDVIE